MSQEQNIISVTDTMSKFVALVGKQLPDDVEAKLKDLAEKETAPLAKLYTKQCLKIRSWQWNLIVQAVKTQVFYSSL